MTDPNVSTDLIATARSARDRSYAPYSGFHMGAAVLTSGGELVPGTLIENVSLGLAMCAERIALFTAATAGSTPTALALVSKRTDGRLTWPCGACLQVALELGGADLVVHVADLEGATDSRSLGELLPNGPKLPAKGSASSR